MEWQDKGLVLSTRRHGERDVILETMTETHGRHLGLVRGGRSPKQAPALQAGNRVQLTWRARLEDHLGQFTAEILESRAGVVLGDPVALHAVTHLAVLMRQLPERDPHPEVYAAADGICALFANPVYLGAFLVRFELLILSELGFGLDLARCAATGTLENLAYVSPKTGRAVSREAGAPWAEKLLSLPAFLIAPSEAKPGPAEIESGFRLAGFFLKRHLYEPRGLRNLDLRNAVISGILARLEQEFSQDIATRY